MKNQKELNGNIAIEEKSTVESIEEKEARLEKMIEEFNLLKAELDEKEKAIDAELAQLEEELNKLNEENNDKEIIILNEPKQIKIEEVIEENVSVDEKNELQKEFPGQNIEKIIEDQVIAEINNKEIVPVDERKKETRLKRKARQIRNYLLAIFVSVTSFQAISFTKSVDSDDTISYDNIKVDGLKDWERIKLYEDEINKLENISIITKAHENSDDKYIIIDKENGKAHRYQGDNLIKSYNICLGDSIGDEQTKLKSIYRKKFEDSDDVFHRNPEVSLDEATYVKNGERYIKQGYEVFTFWNKGNMRTGAGIYTVSNKGPFLDDFGIFLKNERGLQVATSLHVNSSIEDNSPFFRFTNGCIGFSKEDLIEIYGMMSRGEKIYIIPDNPKNKFQIIDGELRFLSNQQNVNRTIRPYEPKPIVLQVEDPTEDAKVWLMTLSENKAKLMSLYPTVSNDIYNELVKISYGIMGQESTFGTYGGPRGQFGRVKDIGFSSVGFKPSVGAGQVRLENIEPKVRKAFNLKSNKELFKTKISAIATMSILLDNYLYVSHNGQEDQYKELVALKYNAALETTRIIKGGKKIEQLGPKAKGYIKKVLNYSELVSVYTKNVNEIYHNPDWNYDQPDQLAVNN